MPAGKSASKRFVDIHDASATNMPPIMNDAIDDCAKLFLNMSLAIDGATSPSSATVPSNDASIPAINATIANTVNLSLSTLIPSVVASAGLDSYISIFLRKNNAKTINAAIETDAMIISVHDVLSVSTIPIV